MKLKCRIKGKEYDFVQGNDFSDEFNETLDSSSIILSNVDKIEDLDILDDVYIFNADEEFGGFYNPSSKTEYKEFKINFHMEIKNDGVNRWNEIYFEGLDEIFKKYDVKEQNIIFNMTNEYPYPDNLNLWQVEYKFMYDNGTYRLIPKNDKFPIFDEFWTIGNDLYGKFPMGLYNEIDNSVYFPYTADMVVGITNIYYTTKVKPLPKFFKHFLVGNFTENTLNLREKKYKYKIDLDSETKGLEVVQLPNISITQPLNMEKKVSTYQIAKNMVDLYSPKIKMVVDYENNIWEYTQKYHLDSSIKDIFDDSYSPDFTLNNPNLRDVLSQLFITKDMIPYVKNNIIYAMDISERGKDFNFDIGRIFYNVEGSKTGENYCDNLKRTYSNALSQDYSCRSIENIGFRNSSTALMTISNMRLETRYPIYKINKIYMCYYKKGLIYKDGASTHKYKMFLCKQDITPLVKLNSERNILSKDFNDFENLEKKIDTIEEMAQYRVATIGYDIGSNIISGWGEKYTYMKSYEFGHWNKNRTYLENILRFMDEVYPLGIYDKSFLNTELEGTESISFGVNSDFFENYINYFDNNSLGLKGIFFQIDYNAFYNGSIIHSKNIGKDKAMINDNSSSSLTLLEKDGLSQQEKVNRYGNKGIIINAIYKDVSELQDVGTVINRDDIGEDYIVYRRQYSIFDNEVKCTYYATKDYVLKNYFTSVYAKHRPYNLMSYSESVRRSENKKLSFLLSKDKLYYENIDNLFKFIHFNWSENDINYHPYIKIFSFAKPSEKLVSNNYYTNPDKMNCGYIKFQDKRFLSDINAFVSGHSLCFNISMFDNVSGGVYVKKPIPDLDFTLPTDPTEEVEGDYTGSLQDWHMMVDDIETGYVKELGFYICHLNNQEVYEDKLLEYDKDKIKNEIYDKLFSLPLVTYNLVQEKNKDYKYEEMDYMEIGLRTITWNDGNIVLPTIIMEIPKIYLKGLNYNLEINSKIETIIPGIINLTEDAKLNKLSILLKNIDNIIKDDNGEIIEIIVDSVMAINDYGLPSSLSSAIFVNAKLSFKYTGNIISFPTTNVGLFDISYDYTDEFRNFSVQIDSIEYEGKIYKFESISIEESEKKLITVENTDIYDLESSRAFNISVYQKNINEKIIGNSYVIHKDNKEVIDMTFQFEPYTNNYNDILFSQWMMKLSDLISTYNKVDVKYGIFNPDKYNYKFNINYTSGVGTGTIHYYPIIVFSVNVNEIEKINSGDYLKCKIDFPFSTNYYNSIGEGLYYYSFEFKQIVSKEDDYIEILGTQTLIYGFHDGTNIKDIVNFTDEVVLKFDLVTENNNYFKLNLKDENKKFYQIKIEEIKCIDTRVEEKPLLTFTYEDFYFRTDKTATTMAGITNKNSNIAYAYNVTEEGYTTIIEKNMFVRVSEERLKNHLVYDEYKKEDLLLTDLQVSQVFNVYSPKYQNNEVIISVDLSLIENKNAKSIQYWYYDEMSNSMKFVFGVNVNDEDWKKGQVMIYISAVSNRNDIVYGQDNLEAGTIINYLDNSTNKKYGEKQYYIENKK